MLFAIIPVNALQQQQMQQQLCNPSSTPEVTGFGSFDGKFLLMSMLLFFFYMKARAHDRQRETIIFLASLLW